MAACTYEIKITAEGSDDICFTEALGNEIKSVKFKMDTAEEQVNDRSSNVISRLWINGDIRDESKEVTNTLLKWSRDFEKSKVYRKVEIIIKIGEEIVRQYMIPDMFCVDYTETFDEDGQKFELELAQRKGSLKEIETYAD